MPELCASGLNAIEAYHSDHTPEDTQLYLDLATRYGLKVTGGSDFHGAIKPSVTLGTGYNGNLRVPPDLLDHLRNLGQNPGRPPAKTGDRRNVFRFLGMPIGLANIPIGLS